MFSIHFKRYFFFIQCIIFYNQYTSIMALVGPNVRCAEENEFPALVSIMKVSNIDFLEAEEYHRCVGTLVSKQDVLTAEHCLQNVFVEPFRIMLGSRDLRNGIEYFPMYVWTYEHWALFRRRNVAYVDHDVAFIKLIGNIPDYIAFAPVGNVGFDMIVGSEAWIAGWGLIDNGTLSRILRVASVRILSKDDCEYKIYLVQGTRVYIDENEFCTFSEPHAVLNFGDSGGPLLLSGSIIGVSNGVCPPAHGGVQAYHLNVHLGIRYYHEFVQDMINNFRVT